MASELAVLGSVILVGLTSVSIFISKDWRYCIAALAVQYIGVFILVNISWPIEMAVAKMVAGWMAGAILGIAMASASDSWSVSEGSVKLGPAFRILAAVILALAIYSFVRHSETWLGMFSTPLKWGGFILIGMGLLQLSLTAHPLRVIIGLLTILSGFEILYAAVETSTLVTGLLAGVNLGLALVGAYLLLAPSMEISQ
jgi:hypothetical protein